MATVPIKLEPVTVPDTDTTLPSKLDPVTVPLALTRPPVRILAPVILPPVIVPLVDITFDPSEAKLELV